MLIDYVVGERYVGRAARLERNRILLEVVEHLVDGREPEMLHATLAGIVERHAQMLGFALEVECQHEFALARLALAHQKYAVAADAIVQHQIGRLRASQRAVEPFIVAHHGR